MEEQRGPPRSSPVSLCRFFFFSFASGRFKSGSSTVKDSIIAAIGTLGENIVLSRAVLAHTDSGLIGVAAHGGTGSLGRLAAVLHVKTHDTSDSILKAADPVVNKVGHACYLLRSLPSLTTLPSAADRHTRDWNEPCLH